MVCTAIVRARHTQRYNAAMVSRRCRSCHWPAWSLFFLLFFFFFDFFRFWPGCGVGCGASDGAGRFMLPAAAGAAAAAAADFPTNLASRLSAAESSATAASTTWEQNGRQPRRLRACSHASWWPRHVGCPTPSSRCRVRHRQRCGACANLGCPSFRGWFALLRLGLLRDRRRRRSLGPLPLLRIHVHLLHRGVGGVVRNPGQHWLILEKREPAHHLDHALAAQTPAARTDMFV